jgi:hypothetical protein
MLCQRFVQGSDASMMLVRPVLFVLFVCSLAGAAEPELGAVQLEATDGTPARLARYLGRPAVLFYEDRGSTELNHDVKDALIARGRREGLLEAVSVIAVANVAAYNFFPARDLATAFIKRAEGAAGIPIFLDLEGRLLAPPWNLPGDTSTVLLLDRAGRIVWRHSGKLTTDQTARMLDRLAAMARDATPAP